jgi:hypothetical protein
MKTLFAHKRKVWVAAFLAGAFVSINTPMPAQAATSFTLNISSGYPSTVKEYPPHSEGPATAASTLIQVSISPSPPSGTTLTLNSSSNCHIWSGGGNGGFNDEGTSYALQAWSFLFTLAAVDDTQVEGTHSCSISGSLASGDPSYNGLTAGPIVITIQDNDSAPAPAPAPAPSTSKPKPSPTPAPETPKLEPAAPPAISAASVKFNDTPISSGVLPRFEEKQQILITGKTIPKGIVSLYIFSKPRSAEVTADEQGNWSYGISDLEPGDHRVESEVTDPATGKKSSRIELAKFAVNQAPALAQSAEVSKYNPVTRATLITGLALSILGLLTYIAWRHRHNMQSKVV